ncbi:hypothetical protein BJQ89_00550 [Arthrobacter sp. ES1]|nr:hypothetical protein [Arthrobacter sp. ES1]
MGLDPGGTLDYIYQALANYSEHVNTLPENAGRRAAVPRGYRAGPSCW